MAGKAGKFGASLHDVVTKAVPCAQEQHVFFIHLFGCDARLLRQCVLAGHGSPKWLVIQRRKRQPRIGKRLGHDGAVNLARA